MIQNSMRQHAFEVCAHCSTVSLISGQNVVLKYVAAVVAYYSVSAASAALHHFWMHVRGLVGHVQLQLGPLFAFHIAALTDQLLQQLG